ncbi:hydroxyethylthiazole kinase [Dermatophilus congolensis]|uniref:hydroxyethylthiazole kinase n=1 Tax=Dermatophilus congolensis TaxID=1863 RepID=UPI001AAFFD8C|nr:hydroxyethylthiazole kinase [Dermatophilus congolensis]MBO3143463.1 hydroxyethylthiazole kinase [Dermatophilus congolensis]MBO3152453.1 hydroxyethylthiazole kinase [Dermatophilus congolensis]MBO3160535.1 hydroxyethylthiazole kinase [Dermatophilus congolensis]MBO3163740.1 hydroxyethylthiazole kinase [Dermatophilus congolensis]MBO3177286.1 hydroxyethylthiazole kinase [Dermatophilus congolensis]
MITTLPAEPITPHHIATAHEALRANSPLVHYLTNIVVANTTANILLAAGAAPAVIDNPHEAAAFATIASGVLINLGTPYAETVTAMREAANGAHSAHTPWVLDPVAAGALPWRTDIARELATHSPSIIRGNASEIMGLTGGAGGRGVDSTAATDDALEAAVTASRHYATTIAVSGATDIFVTTTAEETTIVRGNNGVPLLARVIGTGCSLGALMAAYASVASPLIAAVAATTHLNIAGELAAENSSGPGSFAVNLLDALDNITADHITSGTNITTETIPA